MKALFIVFLIGLMTGCRSQRVVTQVPVETRTTVVERLVEVQTPADSAWLNAWFECDSNYNVLLKRFDEHSTSGMQTGIRMDTVFSFKVIRNSDKVYIPVKDSSTFKEVPVIHEVPVKVNELKGWQRFLIWCGLAFLIELIIITVYFITKWKLRS